METVHGIESEPSRRSGCWSPQTQREMPPPAYLHIATTISDRLARGVYQTGGQLPSESQFCSEFGVSHMTVRRALGILAEKGLVSTVKGRGTFARALDLGDSVFSLRQLIDKHVDGPVEVQLLSAAQITANARVATMLLVPPGDPIVYLRHLVLSGGTPAIYHREHVVPDPERSFIDVLLQSVSLHGLFQAATAEGEGFPRGRITLRATTLGRAAARLFGEPPEAPALCVEHLFQDMRGRPVSWGYFLLRADLFRLQSILGPEIPDAGIPEIGTLSATSRR